MSKPLVIVESPAKVRTIKKYLGNDFNVAATIGHIKDLPRREMGIDVDNGFTPEYTTIPGKQAVIQQLKKAAGSAEDIYLAPDPDREGEAIAWHTADVLQKKGRRFHRVLFHELTKEGIQKAIAAPEELDRHKYEAQQARRILDRLVGYQVSPLLWRKVKGGLSAGRVQTVALRIICERERAIQVFVPQEYWSITAHLAAGDSASFTAKLVKKGKEKLTIPDEAAAQKILAELQGRSFIVDKVQKKTVHKNPPPPFTTSKLQQEASRRLRFTASQTMAVAQQLYEGVPLGKGESVGLITYMRTDSPHLAAGAVSEIRDFIASEFGAEFVPSRPHRYTSKSKFAQEAHEAIRPTSVANTPDRLKPFLDARQLKLYTLIWQRAVASQMSPSRYENIVVSVDAVTDGAGGFLLEASSSRCVFEGFEKLYREHADEPETGEGEGAQLPDLKKGEKLSYAASEKEQKFTQPPARYTEATLVKALEQKGIGRPSTYAPTLSVIQYRDYVVKETGKFRPTKLGRVVNDLLNEHFPRVVDVGFTARMEGQLDDVAQGERDWVSVVNEFYQPFVSELDGAEERIARVNVTEPTDEVCPNCGKPMVVRSGRFGRFVACSGYPECKTTKKLSVSTGARCPECGADIVVKRSKKGKTFYGCSKYPECKFAMPRKPVATPCPKCGRQPTPCPCPQWRATSASKRSLSPTFAATGCWTG